jgi:UDP-N-acetylmuramoyl-L-alanyl-D-glutamate--2,6-diaminopimelate ligase
MIEVLGITGTNAKTKTTYLLETSCGPRVGRRLIGTVRRGTAGTVLPSERTTPDRDFRPSSPVMPTWWRGAETMRCPRTRSISPSEACRSSAAGSRSHPDHLDYHGTLDDYWSVKRRLSPNSIVASRGPRTSTIPAGGARSECGRIDVGRSPSAVVPPKPNAPAPFPRRSHS